MSSLVLRRESLVGQCGRRVYWNLRGPRLREGIDEHTRRTLVVLGLDNHHLASARKRFELPAIFKTIQNASFGVPLNFIGEPVDEFLNLRRNRRIFRPSFRLISFGFRRFGGGVAGREHHGADQHQGRPMG